MTSMTASSRASGRQGREHRAHVGLDVSVAVSQKR